MSHFGILGSGSFGQALALLLDRSGHQVCLWGRPSKNFASLQKKRHSVSYLNKVTLPHSIQVTDHLGDALTDCDVLILATPTQATRNMTRQIKKNLSTKIPLVIAAKGFEQKTSLRNSEVLKQELGHRYPFLVLSGPSHAEEIANQLPCSVTLAAQGIALAEEIQPLIHCASFRVYTSQDVKGVEIGGAIKNIIAIAAGMCDGLKLGSNAKAALVTRGLVEIKRFGHAEGAKTATFDGLSGLGDLITTCFSSFSRNRAVGEALGQGRRLDQILGHLSQVAEGVPTALAVAKKARQLKIDMPITQQVDAILKGKRSAQAAVELLMSRAPRQEK